MFERQNPKSVQAFHEAIVREMVVILRNLRGSECRTWASTDIEAALVWPAYEQA